MKSVLGYTNDLIEATNSGGLPWEYMEDAPCLTSTFEGKNFILCKTETDKGLHVISLNYLNNDGELICDFQKWNQGEPEYPKLDELYLLACKYQVLKQY